MAPAYKLTYFDIRGVAEPIRFLLKYGCINFEDNRVKIEDWPEMKNTTPFGQLPFFEHDGKIVNQSVAICRYVAKLVGLAGKDEWEDMEIDAIGDTLSDLRIKISTAYREKDEQKREALTKITINETIPYYFSRFEAIAQKNNGHLALGRLTWPDLFFAAMGANYDVFVGGDALEKYPNLKALRAKVEALLTIKNWLESRPKSDF